MNPGTIRVVLVDDQQLFRSGLAVIIGAQPDMEVVGQASDGAQSLEVIAAQGPDVVLMDVQMSPMGGVETTREIFARAARGNRAAPRVIMLTTFDWDRHAVDAVRHGASGFLLKDSTPEFVCESIRTVFAGHSVIAPQNLDALLGTEPEEEPQLPGLYGALTEREREVFAAVARGLANPEICAQLFLSASTVKTHIGSILRKLELRDRVQIVVYSYENRIGR